MKKTVVIFAIVFLGAGLSFAGGPKNLYKEINRKIKLDFSSIHLNKTQPDFVNVKFKIVDDKIQILHINGTYDKLTEMIQSELEEIIIKSDYEQEKTYKYKFTFTQEV